MKKLYFIFIFVFMSSTAFAEQGQIKQTGFFSCTSKVIGDDKGNFSIIYEGTIDCIDFIHSVRVLEPERTFEINPIIMYRYKDRDFCIKHNGVEKFQNLWRKFHYQIMPRYKNIHNLQHRSIYGKFKKQI